MLQHFAETLNDPAYPEMLYVGHVIIDDIFCPEVCDSVILPLGLSCHGASTLNSTAEYHRVLGMRSDCKECVVALKWDTLFPLVLASGIADHYHFIWAFEDDMLWNGTDGRWGALFTKYDRAQPTADIIGEENGVLRCSLKPNQGAIVGCWGQGAEYDSSGNVTARHNRAGNVEVQGLELYHKTLMASRYSARLWRAVVSSIDAGVWALHENLWPSVCMGSFGDCSIGDFEPDDRGRVLDCCPNPWQTIEINQNFVLPVLCGNEPSAEWRMGLLHPVKWLRVEEDLKSGVANCNSGYASPPPSPPPEPAPLQHAQQQSQAASRVAWRWMMYP